MIKNNIIWVLWGMWPYASLRCYNLLLNLSIKYSKWINNNDFPHIIIDNIPVKDLTRNNENLLETVSFVRNEFLKLKWIWVNIFLMACNTMHLYYNDIFETNNDLIILSLINETVTQIKKDWHKIVWILWSTNTIKSSLFQKSLEEKWILWVVIDDDIILENINNIILKIIWWKKDLDSNEINILKKSISILQDKWATWIILGCTELPVVFDLLSTSIKLYDPLIITIEKACKIYYNTIFSN